MRTLQVTEADIPERTPDCDIDSLPGAADVAYGLEVAMAVVGTAFGDMDRTFQRVDDVGSADLVGRQYPPWAPRVEATSFDFANIFNSLLVVGNAIPVAFATSAALVGRSPSRDRCASTRVP